MSEQIKIKSIREKGDFFLVSINVLENPLRISKELHYKYRLKEGIVLTRPQLEQLEHDALFAECDYQVARMLTRREHSRGEIKLKLIRKKFPREVIEPVVKKYINMGLIDDAHYAQQLVNRALQKNPAGKAYLLALLQRKAIDRSLAENVVSKILVDKDEVELAEKSLEKRWSSWQHLELESARNKAYNYLSRRGISYPAAKAAFEKLVNRKNEGF